MGGGSFGFGVSQGETRTDLDADLIGSILEWTMDRFQDALLTEEFDPGLFRKSGPIPQEKERRIEQFVEFLRRAVGSDKAQVRSRQRDEQSLQWSESSRVMTMRRHWRKLRRFRQHGMSMQRITKLERQAVFSADVASLLGRYDHARAGAVCDGDGRGRAYLVAVRGNDGALRAFYNVCRHHAAAVVTEPCRQVSILHSRITDGISIGWNAQRDAQVDGVKNFERKDNGLVPVKVETWEKFVFVNLDAEAAPLAETLVD